MRHDYYKRRLAFAKTLGVNVQELDQAIVKMYSEQSMSAQEIADILSSSGEKITPRSLQRNIKKLIVPRTVGDSFRLAIERGRVKWAYKDPSIKCARPDLRIAGMRYKILTRDGFKCCLCGETASTTTLEVDHIIPVCKGGETTETNLRTLCHACNVGKRISERET